MSKKLLTWTKGTVPFVHLMAVVLACVLALTGCHGSRGIDAFELPEEWDSSKTYEITF